MSNFTNQSIDSNFTSPNCQSYTSYQDHFVAQSILTLLYTLVFLVAVSGNTLVVYVVLSNKDMQSVTNIFITNLAVADILVNFTSLWLTPCYIFLGYWVFGSVLCHGFPLFQGMSTFISSLTLTAIAIDRYLVILYPFRPRMSIRFCIFVVGGIWILGSLLVAPLVAHMNLYYYDKCDEYVCREEWNSKMRTLYSFIVLSLQFGVPFTVIAYCYLRIWIRLQNRKSMTSENRSKSTSNSDELRKKRLLKMMVCMVVVFGLCWLPVNALNVLRDAASIDLEDYFVIVFLCAHLSSMSATCFNPLIYAWMNENFRREFQAVLPCFRETDRLRRSSSINRGGGHRGHQGQSQGQRGRRSTCTAFDQTILDSVQNRSLPRGGSSPFLNHRNNSEQSILAKEFLTKNRQSFGGSPVIDNHHDRSIDIRKRALENHRLSIDNQSIDNQSIDNRSIDSRRQSIDTHRQSIVNQSIDTRLSKNRSLDNNRPWTKLWKKEKTDKSKNDSANDDPNVSTALLTVPDQNTLNKQSLTIGRNIDHQLSISPNRDNESIAKNGVRHQNANGTVIDDKGREEKIDIDQGITEE